MLKFEEVKTEELNAGWMSVATSFAIGVGVGALIVAT